MGYSVLVVDDETNIRKTLEGVLSDDGYHVLQAGDGTLALEVLSRSFVDAVLLDVWLPGMDGLETLKRIREAYPIVPVIMISGHGTIDMAVKAVKMGAFDFISKPPDLNRLLITIRNAIDKSSLITEKKVLQKKILKNQWMMI